MNTEPSWTRVIVRKVLSITAGTMAVAVAVVTFPGVARMASTDAIGLYNVRPTKPIAARGYDVVAYHRSNAAVKGVDHLTLEYQGITYRFSTEDNLKSFEVNPRAYMPAHGGWCSSAMAFGRKVDIDPENFIVDGGRLFLFYKGIRGDAKKDWLENQPQWLNDADSEWEKLSGEKPFPGVD